MDGVSWIKLQTDMFNNRKIKQIEDLPDADSVLVIWFKLLFLAGCVNDCGLIYFSKDIPYTEQMLATEFNRPLTTIQYALNIFVRFHMIEIVNDIILVSNWEHYQNAAKLAEIREYNRLAKQKSREKQKMLPTEKESAKEKEYYIDLEAEDIEKEGVNDMSKTCQRQDSFADELDSYDVQIKKPRKKKKEDMTIEDIPKSYIDILDANKLDGELKSEFLYFILMRIQSSKKYTLHALELSIKKVRKLYPNNVNKQIECISQSIERGWEGLFEINGNYKRYGATGVQLAQERDSSLDVIF